MVTRQSVSIDVRDLTVIDAATGEPFAARQPRRGAADGAAAPSALTALPAAPGPGVRAPHRAPAIRAVGLVAVGFSPADRLAAITRHLGWPGRVLSDPQRVLYRRLALPRGALHRIYSPGTLATYTRAMARRQKIARPEEDTRQLGGDAVVRDGVVVALWRPRSPDDRPAAAAVSQAATAVRAGGGR